MRLPRRRSCRRLRARLGPTPVPVVRRGWRSSRPSRCRGRVRPVPRCTRRRSTPLIPPRHEDAEADRPSISGARRICRNSQPGPVRSAPQSRDPVGRVATPSVWEASNSISTSWSSNRTSEHQSQSKSRWPSREGMFRSAVTLTVVWWRLASLALWGGSWDKAESARKVWRGDQLEPVGITPSASV